MINREDKSKQTTDVTIFGGDYVLSSQESEDYTHRISSFVDRKMSQIAVEQNIADTTKVAIMAALDIADQLIRKRETRSVSEDRAMEALARLTNCLGENEQNGDGEEKTSTS